MPFPDLQERPSSLALLVSVGGVLGDTLGPSCSDQGLSLPWRIFLQDSPRLVLPQRHLGGHSVAPSTDQRVSWTRVEKNSATPHSTLGFRGPTGLLGSGLAEAGSANKQEGNCCSGALTEFQLCSLQLRGENNPASKKHIGSATYGPLGPLPQTHPVCWRTHFLQTLFSCHCVCRSILIIDGSQGLRGHCRPCFLPSWRGVLPTCPRIAQGKACAPPLISFLSAV